LDIETEIDEMCLLLLGVPVSGCSISQSKRKSLSTTSSGVCTGAEVWLSIPFPGTETKKSV